MPQAIRHIRDTEVDSHAETAAHAACAALDSLFPGGDNGGITSNFQGHLKDVILTMLAGRSVLAKEMTSLPRLILTDASFGSPLVRGDSFLVIRRSPDSSPERPEYLALDDNGRHFVPLTAVNRIDPCTSFEAGVRSAVAWLRAEGTSQEDAQLHVVPAAAGEHRYVLNPENNPYVKL